MFVSAGCFASQRSLSSAINPSPCAPSRGRTSSPPAPDPNPPAGSQPPSWTGPASVFRNSAAIDKALIRGCRVSFFFSAANADVLFNCFLVFLAGGPARTASSRRARKFAFSAIMPRASLFHEGSEESSQDVAQDRPGPARRSPSKPPVPQAKTPKPRSGSGMVKGGVMFAVAMCVSSRSPAPCF